MDDPARFLLERAELERLEHEIDWLTTAWRMEAGEVAVDLDMVVHGRTYAGRMIYPDVFPNSPPYIRPRDASERWSIHQYGEGGSLCLQWRADNWQIHVTGADIVRSAYELLSTEQHPVQPGVVPSAHRLTPGQSMWSTRRRLVATVDLLRTWLALPLHSRSALKTTKIFNRRATVTFVCEVADSDGIMRQVADLPSGLSLSIPLFSVPGEGWVFRSEAFVPGADIDTVEDMLRTLSEAGFEVDDILVKEEGSDHYKAKVVVLLGTELDVLRVFSIDSGEHPTLSEHKIVLPSATDIRLPEDYGRLSNIRVGIVGLGSIGSKVAISLARSGVRRFLLVDDDYLIPGNLVRHGLSWVYVGVHKVDAVEDALTLVAPGVDVDIRSDRIGGQVSAVSAAATLKDLSNCDLLIDATASSEVFLRLAAIAKTSKKSLCWGELFATGYGGMIARARPDLDPNPLAVRDAFHAHLNTLPPAPFQQADGYDGGQEEPLVAHDSDVEAIAAALTRLAIDTALQREPSEFPYPIYLIGLRREWVFEAPFDTRPIDAQGGRWDEAAGEASDEDRLAAVKALLKMYEETPSADANPAP